MKSVSTVKRLNSTLSLLSISISFFFFSACGVQLDGAAQLAAAAAESATSSPGILTIAASSIPNTRVGSTSTPVTFTVSHSGSTSATISARSLTLGGSSRFAITGGTCTVGASLSGGSTCTLTLTFTPTTAGSFHDTLNLAYTSSGVAKTATRSIAANGRVPAILSVALAYFPPVKASFNGTVYETVTNIGGSTATLSSFGLVTTLFSINGGTCTVGGSLPVGSTCTVGVKFTPDDTAVIGSNTDTLSVGYDDGVTTQTLTKTVTATATTATEGALAVGTGSFANTLAGNTDTVTFTVTNYGAQPASSVYVTVDAATNFTIDNGTSTCAAGPTLAPSDTCTVVVTFTPTVPDIYATGGVSPGGFTVGYHNSSIWNSVHKSISATGVLPAIFTVTGSIPNTVVGATSSAATLTLTNSGGVAGTITGIGLGTASYTVTGGTCAVSGSVAAAGTCTILMTFTPPSTGAQSDTLTVDYTDGVGPVSSTLSLNSSGLSPAVLSIGTGKFSHPNVGSTSSPVTFTVTNSGDSPATIASRSLTTGSQFAITGGTCSAAATVVSGGTCTIIATFSPTSTGTKTDTLNLSYNNGLVTTSATRAISSTTPIPALLEITTNTFAVTSVGNTSAPVTFTVSNEGDTTATISARSLASGGASEFTITGGTCAASATVAPLATCTLILTFSPLNGGVISDTLNLDYNDTISPQTATLAITGTAPSPLRKIAAGTYHSCRIVSGVLQCWGNDGVTNYGSSAVTVDSGTSYKHVTVGINHSCGITVAGVLKCWGANGSGQLGGGGATEAAPITIDSGTSYAVVSAGQLHTCGVTTGGDLKCWGEGNVGQLGNGGSASASPTVIDSGVSYVNVSVGGYHTCATVTDGTLKCFGTDYVGESGGSAMIGMEIYPIVPFSGAESSGLGSYHSCAINGGSLYCFGYNATGALGIGDISVNPTTPTIVDSGTSYSMVDGGGDSDGFSAFDTCAITASGILKCAGSLNGADVMTVVDSGVSYSEVSVGDFHACGITTGGVTKCWGANGGGQLGNGSITPSATPVIAP